MDSSDLEWRRWPSPGAASALGPSAVKLASAPPALDLESIVSRTVGAMQKWASALPPGLAQVANLRDDGTPLPAVTRDNIWRHPKASPAALALLLLDKYGQDFLAWEPETVLETLKRDGHTVSNANRVKILALRVVFNSPSPWRQWEVFHWVCLGLSGHPPNFHFVEEPEMGHLVSGWDFMKMVDPERDTTDEVDKFVAAVFKHEGIPFIPEPLDWAQRELEDPMVRCSNCDAIHRDDNDQKCVTCGSPRLVAIPYEFADMRDEVKGLWTDLHLLPLEVAVDRAPNSSAGNAVYRLLVHWDYANQGRLHTAQQLRMLGDR